MKQYWITLATGEFGYLWAEKRPMFAEFVTITVETWEGEVYQVRGQVYKIE
jgi:alkanesulfonate monooxygenase SsuD/methylene tetrahydromethanopterin reductase-like flavin-dependent oxidoreductase (luciferase family)